MSCTSGSRPKPAADGQPPRRILFRRDPDPINRLLQRFTVFLWRIRHGWAVTLLIGTLLAAISIWPLVTHASLPRIVMQIVMTMLLLAWMCFALLTGMFRRGLRGPAAQWNHLTVAGKMKRAVVTALGTAALLAPFVWLGWLILC